MYEFYATSWHMNPCPWVHEIYTLSRRFIGHHYNILRLSDLCQGLEKKIFKVYGHAPAQEPWPGIYEIYNLLRPFLGHHCYALS